MKDYSVKRIKERIEPIQEHFAQGSCYLFEEYFDLYYLTGLKLSKGVLCIGNSVSLFVDGRYIAAARQLFPYDVFPLDELEKHFKNTFQQVFFDGEKTTYQHYLFLQKVGSGFFELKNHRNPLKDIRMVKSDFEIQKMEKSAKLNCEGVAYIISLLKEGVSEKELAKAFEIFCLERGADKLAFEPIIAFGVNSAMPHHRASSTQLQKNQLVLIDVGIIVDDYASDMTRTVCFGKLDPKLQEMRDDLLCLYQDILSWVKPGVSVKALDQRVRNWMKEKGYGCLHSLGHSLGLEVHEYPKISALIEEDTFLKKNMVITIEPGIYIEGLGGVRQEDTIVIQDDGFENFYCGFNVC